MSVKYKLGVGDSDDWEVGNEIIVPIDGIDIEIPKGTEVTFDGDIIGSGGVLIGGNQVLDSSVIFNRKIALPSMTLRDIHATIGSHASVENTDFVVNQGSLALGTSLPISVEGYSNISLQVGRLSGFGSTPQAGGLPNPLTLDIHPGARFARGQSPGLFHAGNTVLQAGSILEVELNGSSVGGSLGYDQVDIDGTIGIGGAILAVDLGFQAADGQEFLIIDNDGSDAIVGTFAGLPEGTAFDVDGKRFYITYVGGDGNDVVLQRNRQPVSSHQAETVNEDTLLSSSVNATDPDADSMMFSVATPPAHASSFNLNTDGTFTYQANEHYSGSDSFEYFADDGDKTATLTVTIDVTPVADTPVLNVSDVSGDEGTPFLLPITSSLVDMDGSESLSFVISGVPENTVLNQGSLDTNTGDWLLASSGIDGLTLESPDNQTFTLTVTATAKESANGDFASTVDTMEVAVDNVAPTLSFSDHIAGSQLLREWTDLITITDPGFDDAAQATSETFTYTIDWDDGTAVDNGTATIDAVGALPVGEDPSALTQASFDASHTYAEDGRYDVTVTVTDDDGGVTVATFEVRVMIRLLDVTYDDSTAVLTFTDLIDAATVTHDSVRFTGTMSGLLNDESASFVVAGPVVTVPLFHAPFASEQVSLILPADRDEGNKPGVWSARSNPIYQPEIFTETVVPTGGTGNWVRSRVSDDFGLSATDIGDLNRDGTLDVLDATHYALQEGETWTWEPAVEWNLNSSLDIVDLVDFDGDGVLEPYAAGGFQYSDGSAYADFDLDGEVEHFSSPYFGAATLVGYEVEGVAIENDVVINPSPSTISGSSEYGDVVAGDFDGDGDMDVMRDRWMWLNPIRNPPADGVTVHEFSSPALVPNGGSFGNDILEIDVADLNGDGRDDLLVRTIDTIAVALAPAGDFVTPIGIAWPEVFSVDDFSPNNPYGSAVLDFDADGDLDLALVFTPESEPQGIYFYNNDGLGNFARQSFYAYPSIYSDPEAADINGDGAVDLVFDNNQVLLNAPVGNGAIEGELTQYAPTNGRQFGEFGTQFDFEGDSGITGQSWQSAETPDSITLWNRDGSNWSEAAIFDLSSDPIDTITDVAATDSAAAVTSYYSPQPFERLTTLRFFNRQQDDTWTQAEQFDLPISAIRGPVDVDGDRAVVYVADVSSGGAVRTYGRDGAGMWSETTTATIGSLPDSSYGSVELAGDHLFVTQPRSLTTIDDTTYRGSVEVYEWSGTGWDHLSQILPASDNTYGIGSSFSYSDGRFVADIGTNEVAVYSTADFVSWQVEQILPVSANFAYFSSGNFGSLALSGDLLAIGDQADTEQGTGAGAVSLYRFDDINGWQFDRKIVDTASDSFSFAPEKFGIVDFNGDELWIGAPGDDQELTDAGSLFLYVDNPVVEPVNPGDFNNDLVVNLADYTVYRDNLVLPTKP